MQSTLKCIFSLMRHSIKPAHLSHHSPLHQSCPCSRSVHCSAALWGYRCGFDRSSQSPSSPLWLGSLPHQSRWDTGFVHHSEPMCRRSRRSPHMETDQADIEESLGILEGIKEDTMKGNEKTGLHQMQTVLCIVKQIKCLIQ